MAPKFTVATKFTAVDHVTSVAKKISASVSGIGRTVGRLSAIFGGLSILGGIKALDAFATRGDDISDVSKRIGMSAEALQEFQYAAKLADISAEDLTGMLQKMNKNLGDGLVKTLAKSNPALARQLSHTKDTGQAFQILMDAIAKETNVQKRAALAQAAFGKSGQAIIDMAGDLNDKRKEARASGAIISDADVEAAQELHTNFLRIKASGMGVLNQVLGRIAKALVPIVDRVSKWITANRELIGQKIDQAIDKISKTITDAYNIVSKLNDMMGGHLVRNLLIAVAAYKSLAIAIGIAKAAQIAFNLVPGLGRAGGAAKGIAGAVAGDALSNIGGGAVAKWGAAAAPTLGAIALPAAIAAGVVIGSAAAGQAYAGWQNSMITDRSQIAGGNQALMSSRQLAAYNAMPPQHVLIDFANMPAGVTIKQNGKKIGGDAGAVTVPLGKTAVQSGAYRF